MLFLSRLIFNTRLSIRNIHFFTFFVAEQYHKLHVVLQCNVDMKLIHLFCFLLLLSGPTWVSPVAAVSQPSLLPHTYALPQPPSFNHSVTAQSPIMGVTPSIQTPIPQHPLMTTHFQMTPQSTQQPPSMVLSIPSQAPYPSAQPTVAPSALTAQANQVVHPSPHSVMGNGHLTSHPGLIQPPALSLTNGQAAAAQAQATSADNQDGPNGLQMLRTVGMGKYEFSDPGHPKGKQRQPELMHSAQSSVFPGTLADVEPVTTNVQRLNQSRSVRLATQAQE